MKRGDIIVILVAVGVAIVAATIIWPDQTKLALSTVVDQLVILTTTEESRLSKLEPETQGKVRELIQRLANQGLRVRVGQTFRTRAEEQAVIDAGKSGVKSVSWHESGRAVDLYPINPDTGVWDANGERDDLFIQMHQEAQSLGFSQIAYNDFWERKYITNAQGKKIWDGGHLEYHGGFRTAREAYEAMG